MNMKKFLFSFILFASAYVVQGQPPISTNKSFATYLRIARFADGHVEVQYDSLRNGTWRSLASNGYANSHGGGSSPTGFDSVVVSRPLKEDQVTIGGFVYNRIVASIQSSVDTGLVTPLQGAHRDTAYNRSISNMQIVAGNLVTTEQDGNVYNLALPSGSGSFDGPTELARGSKTAAASQTIDWTTYQTTYRQIKVYIYNMICTGSGAGNDITVQLSPDNVTFHTSAILYSYSRTTGGGNGRGKDGPPPILFGIGTQTGASLSGYFIGYDVNNASYWPKLQWALQGQDYFANTEFVQGTVSYEANEKLGAIKILIAGGYNIAFDYVIEGIKN